MMGRGLRPRRSASYDTRGYATIDRQGRDVSLYRWRGPQPTGVVDVEGTPVGMDHSVKMGLWTDDESYWRVHDAVTLAVTPEDR